MIKRKLTRLEVTLDDTKELDELFSKPAQLGLVSATTTTTTTTNATGAPSVIPSKLANNLYQKHLLLLGKQYENSNSQNTESSEQQQQQPGPSTASTSSTTTTTTGPGINTEESNESQLGYNPQPYNPSSRFQLNQESQQLR